MAEEAINVYKVVYLRRKLKTREDEDEAMLDTYALSACSKLCETGSLRTLEWGNEYVPFTRMEYSTDFWTVAPEGGRIGVRPLFAWHRLRDAHDFIQSSLSRSIPHAVIMKAKAVEYRAEDHVIDRWNAALPHHYVGYAAMCSKIRLIGPAEDYPGHALLESFLKWPPSPSDGFTHWEAA